MLSFLLFVATACNLLATQEPPIPPIIADPPPPAAFRNLESFASAEIPPRDLVDLTRRLRGIADVPRTLPAPDEDLPMVGDSTQFWYEDHGSDRNVAVDAQLIYQSEALSLWLEEGLEVDRESVARAADTLETEIIPTNRAFFGEQWQPGVNGNSALNILHLNSIGANVVGYFSAADQFVSAVNPYSNQREMFYVGLDHAPLGSEAYYQVIAHEMQHMIHWYQDNNETTWIDEGMAVLAADLNGYQEVGFDRAFAAQPDVQLTNFDYETAASGAHYGAAYLFSAYYLDRFGDQATQALVRHPENGARGVEAALAELGQPLTFEALFADWVATNYLDSLDRGLGIHNYERLDVPEMTLSATHSRFPVRQQASTHQFGADYIRLEATSPLTLVFTGTQQIPLLSTTAHSGDYLWSTYPADDSDVTLTAEFDLSNLDSATLSFWSWYEIEEGWDYAYVLVSADGGQSWHILETEFTTEEDPHGNSYGPGLTGNSGPAESPRWVEQTADLTPYSGAPVLVRFEYVTDDALHYQGFALDDIRIPELDYSDDVEQGVGRWEAHGFVRHSNVLPQSFLLQSIFLGPQSATVEPLLLDSNQRGQWTLPLDSSSNEAILIITAVTPLTDVKASYVYELIEAPANR